MKKYKYIYWIRALAIMAVVVCHQQWILHESEWIQMLTLYSVTTLILLAGLTQGLWFGKHPIPKDSSILVFMVKKLMPILCSYAVGTCAYLTLDGIWTGQELEIFWTNLIGFSAVGPFYFLKYYIALTLLSPMLYAWVKWCSKQKLKLIWYIVSEIGLFLFGYWTIGKLNVLGQSYIPIYVLGLILGLENLTIQNRKSKIVSLTVDLPVFLFGVWSLKQYYFRSVEGITEPFGIDMLVPKLDMNPPNLSIIVYSLSLFLILFLIFQGIELSENAKIQNMLKPLEVIGKYSMDIFIWHMFIQKFLNMYFYFPSIWVKRIIFYGCMFGLPILGRYIYTILKKQVKMLVS